MKYTSILALAALSHSASAHYIFNKVVAGSGSSTASVRLPANNSPVQDINDPAMRCNSNAKASETFEVSAGSQVSFVVDNDIYHKGTGALYLGKAPGKAADWDGSGNRWFKIVDIGPTFNPFDFPLDHAKEIKGTIPADIQSGEYLLRVEHTALHATKPEWYISCAQLRITGGGNASPPTVNIPGHLDPGSPGLTTDIYYPIPTSWVMPGPAVYTAGSSGKGNNNNNNGSDDPAPAPPVPSSQNPEKPNQSPSPNTPGKTCKKRRAPPVRMAQPRRHLHRSHSH